MTTQSSTTTPDHLSETIDRLFYDLVISAPDDATAARNMFRLKRWATKTEPNVKWLRSVAQVAADPYHDIEPF